MRCRTSAEFCRVLYPIRTKAFIRVVRKKLTISEAPLTLALHLPSLAWGSFTPEEAVVDIRFPWTRKFLAAVAVSLFAFSLASSQTVNEEGKRKVKVKTAPGYPELARRMNISGKVRIEVVIAPDGHVRSTRAIGGHPVLVQACTEAIRDWKYEAATEETTQIVEFDFKQQ